MTKSEIYLATINGEYSGDLPNPNTKSEQYLYAIAVSGLGTGGSGTSGKDGRGIVNIEFLSSSEGASPGIAGAVDTYQIKYTDSTTSTYTVQNGSDGKDGATGAAGKDGSPGTSITIKSVEKVNSTTTVKFSDDKSISIDDGVSIESVAFTSSTNGEQPGISGATDTYTITFSDNSTSTFTIYNGKDGANGETGVQGETGATGNGIKSCEQTTTSTANYGKNIITITMTDGTTSTFEVRNGRAGVTPYIGSNGNWYTDTDTGIPATPAKQIVKLKNGFITHGSVEIPTEAASSFNSSNAKQVFCFGKKFLVAGTSYINVYSGVPDEDDETVNSDGLIEYSSFQAKKVYFIRDRRNNGQAIIYVLTTNGALYYTTIVESDISEGVFSTTFSSIGQISSDVTDMCVCENTLYILYNSQLLILPNTNGDPGTPLVGNMSGIESAERLYSEGHYVYAESLSEVSIANPMEIDSASLLTTGPVSYPDEGHNIGNLCYWGDMFFGIDSDAGTVFWAKNDMQQVFELESPSYTSYVDGMFKPFPYTYPDVIGGESSDIRCSENYLLIFGSGLCYIYKKNPVALLGRFTFPISSQIEILQIFESDNYLYILTSQGSHRIQFMTESRRLQSVLS